jgi:hypothetical protein
LAELQVPFKAPLVLLLWLPLGREVLCGTAINTFSKLTLDETIGVVSAEEFGKWSMGSFSMKMEKLIAYIAYIALHLELMLILFPLHILVE